MAPKKLEPWLGEFVKRELEEVIAWKQTASKGIKIDPESRFGDDGSNFRSSVEEPPSPGKVQLIEVKFSTDVAIVVLSDGDVKIEATLSGEALTTFEEESAAPISTEVWGDVFQLVRFTVVSTSLGRPYVKLDIEEIEYERPYRSTFGNPTAFEDEVEVVALREQIKQLRARQLSAEDELSEWRTRTASAMPPNLQTQQTIEIQHRMPRTHRGPTMAKDGLEVEAGDNLQPPIQALSGARVISKESGAKLLALLNGRAPSPIQPTVDASIVSNPIDQTTLQPTASSPTVISETPRKSVTIEAKPAEDAKIHVASESTLLSIAFDKPPPSAQEPSGAQPAVSSQTKRIDLLAYGRRKVPSNQRKLLDHPSSWLPSLPGRQFPRPNVPMELLTKWNLEATSKPQNSMISQMSAVPASQPMHDYSESGQSSSDEPLAEEEWPKSPEYAEGIEFGLHSDQPYDWSPSQPPDQRIPPPSTIGSVIRSTQDDLEVAAPRTLTVRKSPPKRQRVEDAQHTLPSKPPLPPRPHFNAPDLNDNMMARLHRVKDTDAPHAIASEASSIATARNQTSSPTSTVHLPAHSDRAKAVPVQSSRSIHAAQARLEPRKRDREEQNVETGLQAMPSSSNEVVASVQIPLPYPSTNTQLSQPLPYGRESAHAPSSTWTVATQAHSRSQDKRRGERAAPSSSQPRSFGLAKSSSQQKPGLDSLPTTRGMKTGPASMHSPEASPPTVHVQSSAPASQRLPPPASPQLQTSASSPPSRSPAENHRVARREFFENAKRARKENWLREHYSPNRTGDLTLVNLMALYRNAFPEECIATLDDFLQAARAAYPQKVIHPGMRYQAHSRETNDDPGTTREGVHDVATSDEIAQQATGDKSQNAIEQVEQGVSRADERALLMDKLNHIRVNWFKQHYLPHTTKSQVRLREIVDVYRSHHPSDYGIHESGMLTVAQQAWPNARVGADTLFLKRSSIASLADSRSSRASNEVGDSRHETVSSNRHARPADRNVRLKQQAKLPDSGMKRQLASPSRDHGTADDEPLTPLAEFCQAFKELKPGNGSAFGKPHRVNAPRSIDVLSWNI